jgi:hypothetical protein
MITSRGLEMNPLAALPNHDALCDPAVSDHVVEARLLREIEVGAEEGDRAEERIDEVGQDIRTKIELVVADRQGVVLDQVHGDGVEEGDSVLQTGVEFGSGQEVVAR